MDYINQRKAEEEGIRAAKVLSQTVSREQRDEVYHILSLINTNSIERAVISINGSNMNREELFLILKSMKEKKFYRNVITVFNRYKSSILQDVELIQILIENTYLMKDYKLFDNLFSTYMQFKPTQLSSYYLELGLKVQLRIDPEFAKQLLYQMVYSDYPIGNDTFYEFFRIAKRVANFQVVKFGLDLIIKNPQIEISDKTFGQLMSSFLQDGNEYDIKSFFSFLLDRNAFDNIEVKMATFVHNVGRYKLDQIWDPVKKFKQVLRKGDLERFYDLLYEQVGNRFDYPNLMTYLNLLEQDGINNNSYKYHERIFQTLSELKDNEKYLKTVKIIRDSDVELSGAYLKLFWKSLNNTNPDLMGINTQAFRKLIQDHFKSPSAQKTLNEMHVIKLDKCFKMTKFSSTNHHLYKRVLPLLQKKPSSDNSDHLVFQIISESIREGKRPPIYLLLEILKNFVKRKSELSDQVSEVVSDLYRLPPIEYYLLLMRKQLASQQNNKSHTLSLVNKFMIENKSKMNYIHYNEVAILYIQLGEFQKALEVLDYGRRAVQANEKPDIISIYTVGLKALSYKQDVNGFLSLLKLIEKDPDVIITRKSLNYIKNYIRFIAARKLFEDTREIEMIYDRIKEKYNTSLDMGRFTIKETIKILQRWLQDKL
ncbi:hypothetical protein WICMUC_005459 [Wickerhamomyces mucosus]|uniref:Uncharacterized protein n=1 Tax=Wickerhamomyces mucosus TaxID=1378264 RepID=A0A9P8P858_9ASCO|nr:hypothetical protein WICMUC_005459 [Wickerhamomyces mucosus]